MTQDTQTFDPGRKDYTANNVNPSRHLTGQKQVRNAFLREIAIEHTQPPLEDYPAFLTIHELAEDALLASVTRGDGA